MSECVFLITEWWVSVGPHVLKSPPCRLITCSQGERDDFPVPHFPCQRSSPIIQCGSVSNVRKLEKKKKKNCEKIRRPTELVLLLCPLYFLSSLLFSSLSLRKSCINHWCSSYLLECLREAFLDCKQSYAQ